MKKFKEMIPNIDDSEFDHYKDKIHYFIEDMPEDIRVDVTSNLQPTEGDCCNSNAFQLIIERAQALEPAKFESTQHVHSRVVDVKEYVRNYIQKYVDSEQKVVILSHFFVLRQWTGEYEGDMMSEEFDDFRRPDKYFHFHNCDAYFPPMEHS